MNVSGSLRLWLKPDDALRLKLHWGISLLNHSRIALQTFCFAYGQATESLSLRPHLCMAVILNGAAYKLAETFVATRFLNGTVY